MSKKFREYTKEQKKQYAISKRKEELRKVSMCIAEDKGMPVKYWSTLMSAPTKDGNGRLIVEPLQKSGRNETAYITQLKLIGCTHPTYKQCCTGLSSTVRDAIVVDVDDDYTVAEKRLDDIRKLTQNRFPEPTFKVINTKTNHIQYMFVLRESVPYEDEKDKTPYQNATRLMNAVLGGDLNFKFYQCKNPMSYNKDLRTIRNLPDSLDKLYPLSYYTEMSESLKGIELQDPECSKLMAQAVEMNARKEDALRNSHKTDKLDRASKNIDKTNRNDAKKKHGDKNFSRNVLAKDYARKFAWYCMLNDIEVDASTIASYLMSKNAEITGRVRKDELLSVAEIQATARCTYRWCIGRYDRDKAKHGSYTDLQRKNSALIRNDKAYFLAKECKKLRESGISVSGIAKKIGIHRNTARKYLTEFDRLLQKHNEKKLTDKKIQSLRKAYKKEREMRELLNQRISLTSPRTPLITYVYKYIYKNLSNHIYKYILNINSRKNNGVKRSGIIYQRRYNNKMCRITPFRYSKVRGPPI